ncbi:MAG: hypothetical protein AB1631_34540 [Acidobacteriota bacterium]
MAKKTKHAQPINFSPGEKIGRWIEQFRKAHGLETKQDALREICRDRMRQDEEEARARLVKA